MFQSSGAKGFKGYFKSLEVTHHKDNPRQFEYHPHIHGIIAVNKSYFKSRDYVSNKKLIQIWREKCKLDYDPSVRIQKVRPNPEKGERNIKGAVCEVTKYTIKTKDITHNTYNGTDRTVKALTEALSNRRLCSFGGIFKEVAKKLKLDDMLDGDLVNTDNEKIREDVKYTIVTFNWRIGIGYAYTGERPFLPKEIKDETENTEK